MENKLSIVEKIVAKVREEIITGLNGCTEAQKLLFRRMYSHQDVDAPIEDIVAGMPDDRLDWALQQVAKTLNKG